MSAPAPLVGFKGRSANMAPMVLSALAVSVNYRHSERMPASSRPLRPCALARQRWWGRSRPRRNTASADHPRRAHI